jgi:proton-dependent oligopeptide transporter, POT family
MFNWFYWTINFGALSSIITTNIEKYHSFWLAYLIPMLVFTGSIAVLLFGRRYYIQNPPHGSLLIRASRVSIAAIQIRRRLGKQNDRNHILDYAKEMPSTTSDDSSPTTTESSHNRFIEDLKQALRACRVFAFYPFYWISYNQLSNNMISQAAQMNTGISSISSYLNHRRSIKRLICLFFQAFFRMIFYRILIRSY